jgi:hypothetical protein
MVQSDIAAPQWSAYMKRDEAISTPVIQGIVPYRPILFSIQRALKLFQGWRLVKNTRINRCVVARAFPGSRSNG